MPISHWPSRRRRGAKHDHRAARQWLTVASPPPKNEHYLGEFAVRLLFEAFHLRDTLQYAIDNRWPPIASAMIEIEITVLLRAVRENADKLELFGRMPKG